MNGLSVKLPLSYIPNEGFGMNTNYLQVAKQNIKMVILTEPGERIMIPDFGVGIKRSLFENRESINNIRQRILFQVNKYLPYIAINNIAIFDSTDQESQSYDNAVNISINFTVKSFQLTETLNLKIKG